MPYSNFEEIIARYSLNAVFFASILLLLFTCISLKLKSAKELIKKLLFISIVTTTIATTLYLALATIYLNNISSSKGPVHWHADLQIWDCDKELDLNDPKGLSNKIGTPTLHEHNDKRIHLEGVVVTPRDASLGKFFDVIGGKITNTRLIIPTTQGTVGLENGNNCPNGQEAYLQVYVYKTIQNVAIQKKISNPSEYIISSEQNIPPGDCIIVEHGPLKEKTDKICLSLEVAQKTGKLKGVTFGN